MAIEAGEAAEASRHYGFTIDPSRRVAENGRFAERPGASAQVARAVGPALSSPHGFHSEQTGIGMELERLIIQHGVLAVFLLAMVEGDLTLILAGVSAHLGLIPLGSAIVAGALGNFAGDTIWFLLGRRASGLIRGSRFYLRVGPTIERLAHRIGIWEVLAARFIWGTRNASMVFWGSHHMRYLRFMGVDLLGCFIACTLFAGLGYALSDSAQVLMGTVKRVELWLLGMVVVAAILVYVVTRLTKRQLGE